MLVTFGIEVGTLNPNEFFMQKYPLVPFFGNKIQVPKYNNIYQYH